MMKRGKVRNAGEKKVYLKVELKAKLKAKLKVQTKKNLELPKI